MAFVSPLPLANRSLLPATASSSSRLCAPTRSSSPPRAARRAPPCAVLAEGASAPSFSAADTDGNAVSLSDFSGARSLVLYFSAGAGRSCRTQSGAFRDAAGALAARGAAVVAVCAQSAPKCAAFKQANALPFPVVADPDGALQRMFDVPKSLGLLPGRVTYVIDKNAVVRRAYQSQLNAASHLDVVNDALDQIS